MADQPQYAYIRDVNNAHDWAYYAQAGITPVLNVNDPNIKENYDAAVAAGCAPAIWIPEGSIPNPEDYGRTAAAYAQWLHPSAVLMNVEQTGKGAAGAEWSQRMMGEYSKYVPPGTQQTVLSVTPMQGGGSADKNEQWDFSAYQQYGASVDVAAFGGNSAEQRFDPDKVYQNLIDAGWTPDQISVALAPGQAPGSSNIRYSLYTIDDAGGQTGLAAWINGVRQNTNQPTGPDGQGPTGNNGAGDTTTGDTSGEGQVPTVDRTPDAKNPAAIKFAKMRLAQLRARGFRAEDYGLEGLDPTAQWRAMSAIMGAQKAVADGHGADYVIPEGLDPGVLATVQGIIAAGTAGEDPGQGGDIRPGSVQGTGVGAQPPGTAPPPGVLSDAAAKLKASLTPPGMTPASQAGSVLSRFRNLVGTHPDDVSDLVAAAARAAAAAAAQGTTPGPGPTVDPPPPQVHPPGPNVTPGYGGLPPQVHPPTPGAPPIILPPNLHLPPWSGSHPKV